MTHSEDPCPSCGSPNYDDEQYCWDCSYYAELGNPDDDLIDQVDPDEDNIYE